MGPARYLVGAARIATRPLLQFMLLLASLAAVVAVGAPAHAQPTYSYDGSGQSIIELLGYKPGLVFYVDPRGDQVNYMTFTIPPGKTYTSAGLEYDHTAYDNTVAHTATISLLSGEPTGDAAGMAEIRTGPSAGTVPVQSPRNVGVASLSPAVVTRMNSLSASGGGVLYLGGHAPLDATYIFAEFTSVKLVGNTNEPSVTAVSPATGSAAGGSSVVITGLNFTGATSVVFGTAAASFVVNDSTQISATAPAGTGTVDIRVLTAGGISATSAAVRFTYLSANANLSALSLSAGTLSPAFASATTSYTASVANATTSLTVTPIVADATASVTVNGVAVTSGNASGAIALAVGSNTITTVVMAPDGTTTKTYTVTVTRAASSNANLSALSLSSGTLSPAFASATTSYTASVVNATMSLTVTPTVADTTASITVNGVAVTSGNAAGAIALAIGSNTITTVVTAQNGAAITYTVTVTRAASSNANLSALSLSSGALAPAFASATTSYTASVANATTSLTVTPTVADATASVTVNGVAVTSGNASDAISLADGANTVTTVVTAQNGTSTQTYTITVNRAQPPVSNNANLDGLSPSVSSLSPWFATATTAYSVLVPTSQTSISVMPTASDAGATITVNGVSVNSGSASGPQSLNVGDNIITVLVTAPDGTTTRTYTVTVTREAPAPPVAGVPTLAEWALGLFALLLAGCAAVLAHRKRAMI